MSGEYCKTVFVLQGGQKIDIYNTSPASKDALTKIIRCKLRDQESFQIKVSNHDAYLTCE